MKTENGYSRKNRQRAIVGGRCGSRADLRVVDGVAFVLFALGLAAICYMYLRMAVINIWTSGMDDFKDGGKIVGVFLLVTYFYLVILSWRTLLRRTSLEVAAALWACWTLMGTLPWLSRYDTVLHWLSGCVFPCILWPGVLLSFSQLGKRWHDARIPLGVMFFFSIYTCLGVAYVIRYSRLGISGSEQAFNSSYYPLLTVPWLFLLKRRWLRNAAIALVLVVVVLAGKRTALLALLASILAASVVEMVISEKKVARLSVASGAVVFLSCAGLLLMSDSAQWFTERLKNSLYDGGSGRLDIYGEYWGVLREMRLGEIVFGHGFNSGSHLIGKSAHNDWIEVVFDFGIVGLVLYSVINVLLLRRAWCLFKQRSEMAPASVASVVAFIVMSMTSHLMIYPNYVTVLAAFWGWVEGQTLYDNRLGNNKDIGVAIVRGGYSV